MSLIKCRAKVSPNCLNGRPASTEAPPHEDGTYDGMTETIVCDACYVAVMPFTPSGMGLTAELPAAIAKARAAKKQDEEKDT